MPPPGLPLPTKCPAGRRAPALSKQTGSPLKNSLGIKAGDAVFFQKYMVADHCVQGTPKPLVGGSIPSEPARI